MAKEKRRYSLRARMMLVNLLIACSSLLLCGVLFVVSVSRLAGSYAYNNMDFFLTEVLENLGEKTQFMEDIVYRLRESEEVMSYLAAGQTHTKEAQENMKETVKQVMDISSERNLAGGNEPVVESVCLFDRAGNAYPDFYYALTYSEIAGRNDTFERMNEEFESVKRNQCDYYFSKEQDAGFFAYTVFDNDMSDCGTVIFEINMNAFVKQMENIMVYQNAFWAVYNDQGMIMNQGTPGENEEERLEENPYNKPYTKKAGNMSFRIYKKNLRMGLMGIVGVPANQVRVILYESMKWYILGIAGVILAALAGFAYFTYKLTRPMKEFAGKMGEVKEGDFEVKLPEYDSVEFHEISTTFNEMTEYINHLINQVYEKQLSVKEMELKFFQTQMNPHFMFNVLNSIALQAKLDGNEEVFQMLSSFTQLIRAKIYRDDKEKVSIGQELKFVEYYLNLQRFRFGDDLSYEIHVGEERFLEFFIPKLCIQLIVENAVVHGIEPKVGAGNVDVRIDSREESLFITVKDNGVGFPSEGRVALPVEMDDNEMHNHVGLYNVDHIIRLMYGDEYGLSIFSKKEEGSRVTIHIPFDHGGKEGKEKGVKEWGSEDALPGDVGR